MRVSARKTTKNPRDFQRNRGENVCGWGKGCKVAKLQIAKCKAVWATGGRGGKKESGE